MSRIILITFIVSVSIFAYSSQKAKNVATIIVKKGMATVINPDGTKTEAKKNLWLREGSIIKTGEKSFVRVSFIDKSTMNVGPKSELKIEKFDKDEPGVINVLTGKIRSKVTKDYLNMDKDKSKLFIKSKSAVMGIRGTEFVFTANKRTGATTAVLIEGSVVFNKINRGDNLKNLEAIVNKGQKIKPGQFSVARKGSKKATVPSKLSSRQFSGIVKNKNFKVDDNAGPAKKVKSVVPPGLSGDVVMGSSEVLKKEVQKTLKIKIDQKVEQDKVSKEEKQKIIEESKGYIRGDEIKPVDGAIVHLETGTIIPLGVDSQFDSNTGEWVSTSVGSVDAAGEYLPPEGYKMTDEGNLLKTDVETGAVKEVVLEIKPLDEVKPLDEIKTVVFEPTNPIDEGPSPAGGDDIDEKVDEKNNDGEGDKEDEKTQDKDRNPDGGPDKCVDCLPPPPPPPGCVVNCSPTNGGGGPKVSPTKSRVRVKVNKQ